MDNQTALYYIIKILIAITDTSDMTPIMKQSRRQRLQSISDEIVMRYCQL